MLRLSTSVGVIAATLLLALSQQSAAQVFGFEFGGSDKTAAPAALEADASSIAVDADGNVWVADTQNSRVVKFDYNGGYIASFDRATGGGPVFGLVRSVAADSKGNILVVPGGSLVNQVVEMDAGGTFVRTIGPGGPAGSPLVNATSVDVDDQGRIAVLDLNRVVIYRPDGSPLRDYRNYAGGSGVAAANGSIYIAGSPAPGESEITRNFLSGAAARKVRLPGTLREIAVDSSGRVYAADYQNGVIKRIDMATAAIEQLGVQGLGEGEMNGPSSVDVDCRGNVYALESAGRDDSVPKAMSKVLKFVEPGAAPPPCAPRPLPRGAIDTQINDVEVSQAVQPSRTWTAGPVLSPGQVAFDLPETTPRNRAWGAGTIDPDARVGEVPLAAGHKTVVRVYANLRQGPAGGLGGVPATLEAVTQAGRRLGPIQATAGPAVLRAGDRTVDRIDRLDPAGTYTFDLPDAWTDAGRLELIARVNPARIGCDSQCVNRSTFHLTGVPFDRTRSADVATIALTDGGRFPTFDPWQVFDTAKVVTPQNLEIWGYQGMVDVGDIVNAGEVKVESCFLGIWPCDEDIYPRGSRQFRKYLEPRIIDRVERVMDDRGLDRCDIVTVGLVRDGTPFPGAMRGEFMAGGLLPCGRGYLATGRPLGTVAHELQHAFGRPHAGQSCQDTRPGDPQEGEAWPPDDTGRLHGIGIDPRTGSGKGRGPHAIIAEGATGSPAQLYDLMSYCMGAEVNGWISPRGWAALHNWRRPMSAARSGSGPIGPQASRPTGFPASQDAGTSADGRALRVTATEAEDGKLGISAVSPAADPATPAARSPYVLEALDADNAVLATAIAAADQLSSSGGRIVSGTVPAPPGTTHIYLHHGNEAAVWYGSAAAPKVRLTRPAKGAKVTARNAVIRWRQSDPDGGDLTARVLYSADGGRRWQGIYIGPAATGRATVPRRLLTGSRRARVRVIVDDSFNQAATTSGRFTVRPSPPTVRITDPLPGVRIGADATLQLRGEGHRADGGPLPARALRWSEGRRRLGRGEAVTVGGLRPGRRVITLAARSGGLTGRARITVRVRAVKPAFLRLDAPGRLSRRARKATLRVASTVSAALKIGGRRYRVGPKARRITVRVKPGVRPLVLRLRLSAGRLSSGRSVTVAR